MPDSRPKSNSSDSNRDLPRATKVSDPASGAAKQQFSLRGFTQSMGVRIFAFEITSPNQTRTEHTVQADITLARKYGITIQELPIMCRKILERQEGPERQSTLTFTEREMKQHADQCVDARYAASLKKRAYRPARATPVSRFQVGAERSPISESGNQSGTEKLTVSKLP